MPRQTTSTPELPHFVLNSVTLSRCDKPSISASILVKSLQNQSLIIKPSKPRHVTSNPVTSLQTPPRRFKPRHVESNSVKSLRTPSRRVKPRHVTSNHTNRIVI